MSNELMNEASRNANRTEGFAFIGCATEKHSGYETTEARILRRRMELQIECQGVCERKGIKFEGEDTIKKIYGFMYPDLPDHLQDEISTPVARGIYEYQSNVRYGYRK